MRCMVTGGAGFIGSNLCERLLTEGHEVLCVDNLTAGRMTNVHHLFSNKNFTFSVADVTREFQMDILMKGIDVIFHQAASKKNVCLKDPLRDCDVNAKGTLNLLMLARKNGVKKFIHASTGSVYGELHGGEEQPYNPVSYYGVSKLAGERYVSLFEDLNPCILRYFHVYGRRQDSSEYGGVISIWIDRIKKGLPLQVFGTGEQQRSFTYVDDVVQANITALNKTGVYNCASGLKITLKKAIETLAVSLMRDIKVEFLPPLEGDIFCFDVDNSKIRNEFNLTFTPFVHGIAETLRYYQCDHLQERL